MSSSPDYADKKVKNWRLSLIDASFGIIRGAPSAYYLAFSSSEDKNRFLINFLASSPNCFPLEFLLFSVVEFPVAELSAFYEVSLSKVVSSIRIEPHPIDRFDKSN